MTRLEFQEHKEDIGFGSSDIRWEDASLRCWQGRARPMSRMHRHDDLEVNLVLDAPLKYLFSGQRVEVKPRHVAVFWGAMPHRLIECDENWQSYVCWIHIPLDVVLGWGLPETAVTGLLRGTPIVRHRPAIGFTKEKFPQWAEDLESGASELKTIALLEIHAAVRRHLANPEPGDETKHEWTEPNHATKTAVVMAQFVALNFREQITLEDIAASAYLHPNYAMSLFRRVVGTTLGAYVTQCRVAEAQRLLITTQLTTNEISAMAGFGSQSGFYATFARICKQPPGEYRRSHQ
jgi:AraC-like DNA-binding protein